MVDANKVDYNLNPPEQTDNECPFCYEQLEEGRVPGGGRYVKCTNPDCDFYWDDVL